MSFYPLHICLGLCIVAQTVDGIETVISSDAPDDVSLLQLGREVRTRHHHEDISETSDDVSSLFEMMQQSGTGASVEKGARSPTLLVEGRDWQDMVPAEFEDAVSTWGSVSQCHGGDAINPKVQLPPVTPPVIEQATIKQVPKNVSIQRPNIKVKEIPVPVSIQQDVLRYKNVTKKIQTVIKVEKIHKRDIEVEVPRYKTNMNHVTTQVGKPVYKDVPISVSVKMPKIEVKEKPIAVELKSPNVVYDDILQNVTVNTGVPDIKKNHKVITQTKIEEVVQDVYVGDYDVVGASSSNSSVPDQIDVEVVKVKVNEVEKLVEIIQDVIKHVAVKQKVIKKVEVPKLVVKQRRVEVPQYKTVLREVPIIEVRQRTIEVIREVPDYETRVETVPVVEEKLSVNHAITSKTVNLVNERAKLTDEVVSVKQTAVNILPKIEHEIVEATETTTTTKDVVHIVEETEVVEKIVEIYVDIEEVVEIPKVVTKEVIKEVPLVITREEIVKVPKVTQIHVVSEEVVTELEDVEVELHSEQLVVNMTTVSKNLVVESIVAVDDGNITEATTLIPKPFAISGATAALNEQTASQSYPEGQKVQKELSQEFIVQNAVDGEEIVQHVGVMTPSVWTREIEVPVWNYQEEVVKVDCPRTENNIVHTSKLYELDHYSETKNEVEVAFTREVVKPVYESETVTMYRDVPSVTRTMHDVHVASPQLNVKHKKVSQTLVQDEVIYVQNVVQVNRSVVKSKPTAKGDCAKDATMPGSPRIRYIEKEVERTVEVAVPTYTLREVEVPVYEVEEVLEEVEVETIVEEIVEVPTIIEVEQIVEVPTIEYNDTIVEKIVKVKAAQTHRQPIQEHKLVPVTLHSTSIDVTRETKDVPVKSQTATLQMETYDVEQTFTMKSLSVKQVQVEHTKPKFVTAKKTVEKLVPKMVERIVQVPVEVVRTIVQEKVVPVYSEKVVKKYVDVIMPQVVEHKKQRVLKVQVVKPKHSFKPKHVDVLVETAKVIQHLKEVPLRGRNGIKRLHKEVAVVVPCQVDIGKAMQASSAPGTVIPRAMSSETITSEPGETSSPEPVETSSPEPETHPIQTSKSTYTYPDDQTDAVASTYPDDTPQANDFSNAFPLPMGGRLPNGVDADDAGPLPDGYHRGVSNETHANTYTYPDDWNDADAYTYPDDFPQATDIPSMGGRLPNGSSEPCSKVSTVVPGVQQVPVIKEGTHTVPNIKSKTTVDVKTAPVPTVEQVKIPWAAKVSVPTTKEVTAPTMKKVPITVPKIEKTKVPLTINVSVPTVEEVTVPIVKKAPVTKIVEVPKIVPKTVTVPKVQQVPVVGGKTLPFAVPRTGIVVDGNVKKTGANLPTKKPGVPTIGPKTIPVQTTKEVPTGGIDVKKVKVPKVEQVPVVAGTKTVKVPKIVNKQISGVADGIKIVPTVKEVPMVGKKSVTVPTTVDVPVAGVKSVPVPKIKIVPKVEVNTVPEITTEERHTTKVEWEPVVVPKGVMQDAPKLFVQDAGTEIPVNV